VQTLLPARLDRRAGNISLSAVTGGLAVMIIAVLLCGGFAVYGLINPGGATEWKQPGSIIVEKETGNRYLYLGGVVSLTSGGTFSADWRVNAAGTVTLRDDTGTFGGLLFGTIVIIGALLFLPVAVLGPIAEHLGPIPFGG